MESKYVIVPEINYFQLWALSKDTRYTDRSHSYLTNDK